MSDADSIYRNTPSADHPCLSVSMIVRNEERFLEGCLQSVQGIADEVVIVDTGSTDATKAIASRYGAHLFEATWVDDFSSARNACLSHCRGDWILYLDADERLASDSKDHVLRAIADPNAVAYSCVVRSEEHLPKGIAHTVASYPRLFRRLQGIRFEGRVHEQIAHSIQRAGHTILASRIFIEHLGYVQSQEIILSKCSRNAELLHVHLKEHPDDFYARFQYGNTLNILGCTDDALRELRLASRGANIPPQVRVAIFNAMAGLSLDTGRLVDALKYATASLKEAPSQVTARWIAASVHAKQHNSAIAVDLLNEIGSIQNDTARFLGSSFSIDDEIPFDVLYARIGYCYERCGSRAEASQAYFKALTYNPAMEPAQERFLANVEAEPDPAAAVGELEWLAKNVRESPELLHQLAQCHMKQKNFPAAHALLERIASSNPEDHQTLAIWMEYHIATGNIKEATKLYEQGERKGVHTREYQKAALRLALLQHDLGRAVIHLERMAQGVAHQAAATSVALNVTGP